MAIFSDFLKESIKVFMDDFSVFGNTYDSCLSNLKFFLKRYVEINLFLNWEKCRLMVEEGIVLGHNISKAWLEVYQAKIDAISKLPPPINAKTLRIFLRHVEFYR
ncbi:uncharacterized protein LOC120083977 [Benincasa hispida]|uniref:uncharacterized protein LOC120083977 n=1 Tax=Benincasa hispida TaxID=102211 RepID=UPI001901ABF7|nr:uncharacterized protein LOC120083977 [Benincasa hispida]